MSNAGDLSDRKAQLSAAKRALLERRLRGEQSLPGAGQAIPRRATSEPVPLSFTQQRIWFLHQLAPDNPSYNIYEAWRVRGPLDVEALERALNRLAERQQALRTRIVELDGQPVQVVGAEVELHVPVIDLRHLAPELRERELLRLANAEARRPFDLASGPLLQLSVVRLGVEDHAILLSGHHIITDEWSNDIFWRELAVCYEELLAGAPPSLPDLPIQYTDFALWQREQLATGALDKQLAYWREQLGGDLPLLQLPADRPRPSRQTFRGRFITQELPDGLLQALQELSQEAGTTLFMTLLAAYHVLLHRYSRQDDILVGTPIANRQRPETKDVIGMFLNTVVMRADLAGNPSFRSLLAQVRQTALAGYDNQDLPFDRVVQELHTARDLSTNPIFQTMFVYESAAATRRLPGLDFTRIDVNNSSSKFDLTWFAWEEDSNLAAGCEYNTDLFDASTVTRMLGHWQTLLEAIVQEPERPVGSLPLLTAPEQEQILVTWNDTALALEREQPLHRFLTDHAARTPTAAALVAPDGRFTYAELESLANRLAQRLLAQGLTPSTPVALYVERSSALLVGILGILKAGGAYVPLDPAYPAGRIALVLEDVQAPFIVTQTHLAAQLPATAAAIIALDPTYQELAGFSEETPPANGSLDDLAYIIYTSGSTGTPKGVMVTHRNLFASTAARRPYYRDPVRRFLLLSSFSFDSSMVGLFWTLLDGGTLVLPPPDGEKDIQLVADLIAREQVSHTLALPSLYRLMLAYAPPGSLSSLQAVIVAGEACPPDLSAEHYELLPHTALYNEYGPTEATVWCSVYHLPRICEDSSVPIGRPVGNYQLLILDPYQQPLPIGVPGELYVGGAGVTPGYYRRPELTAERFLNLPFDELLPGRTGALANRRFYRTGDLALWRADGEIQFLGRVDNQVKIRGYRLEPDEIEAALRRHSAVQDTAVTVWERERTGSGADKSLVAYVVLHEPANGAEGAVQALESYLSQHLPDYMVPRHFVVLPQLPRTPNGKLDRGALPEPQTSNGRERPFAPPHTAAEKILARIWSAVLRLPQVGIHDKFFELGGDSILGIQMIARARQEGLILTPRQLFSEQTIARLALVTQQASALEPAEAGASGPVPLTPVQHWFFEQQLENPDHWNQATWFEAATAVNADHLAAALAELVAHHAILRARYQQTAEGWRQTLLTEAPPVPLTRVSLVDLTPEAQDEALLREAAILHAALDITNGPLVRAALFDLGPDRLPRLLLIIHHLVVDAVSWDILTADLLAAYWQIAAGEPVVLPSPPATFAQWARALAHWAGSDGLRAEVDYWERVSTAVAPTLPADHPGQGANKEGQARLLTTGLDAEATSALLREANEAYHTRSEDLLLAALVRAMTAWTGQPGLLLTLERHGREALDDRLDISLAVGWFTALFPVLLMPDNEGDLGADIRAVKEQLRRIPHNGLGYGVLRYLADGALRERLANLPRPQLLFNYLGQLEERSQPGAPLRPLSADAGPVYGPDNTRAHLLDINAWVSDGCLRVSWQYASTRFRTGTIERLAQNTMEELARIIAHCTRGGSQHTPSDFPLSNLAQDDLDELADLLAELD